MRKRWFESRKHRHNRLLHNERCRRYYQRHLSKKAREKQLRAEIQKQRRKAVNEVLKQKDVSNVVDTNWL